MNFYPNGIFHVYNQGNNGRTIFFRAGHYQFFTWKMKAYLLPFADIVSYCLMPTHYHWQLAVKNTEIRKKTFRNHVVLVENERRLHTYGASAKLISPPRLIFKDNDFVTINESIGV